jgi:aryl-alcohol dehydrogenase-like predicted oxidoreductase
MTLPTVRLGRTELEVTRVGLGAWAIGGPGWRYGWGSQDDEHSVATVRHAVEAGISWIDTAACYGRGHSEEIVARALRDLPEADRPLVFTKAGVIAPAGDGDPSLVGDPASLRRELEGSLRRLGVEAIDLYQMHWPAEDGTALEEYWQAFADFKAEGKVRHIGLSNHCVKQLEAAEKLGPVETLQPPFSAIRRETAAELLPWAAAQDVGVIVYSPQEAGLLTGAFTAERAAALPADDWRAAHPDYSGLGLDANLGLAGALATVGQRHGVGAGAIAVAWTLAWQGVSAAIVGARRPAQIDGWIAAAGLTLDDDDLDAIAAAIEQTGAGAGPAHPAANRSGDGR